MKKLLAVAAILSIFAVKAKADGEPMFQVGYSSYSSVGVRCSTGTAIQINASVPAGSRGNVAGYNINNLDGSNKVFIGGISVSTKTAVGDSISNLGAPIAANGSKTLLVGKDPRNLSALVPIYCKASDAAGSSGSVLAVEWFFY